ncbi:SusE domain-containing protein [Neolewinella antarctica]|uniref:SusE outer membrane protein domain-containing protein n=1 Tax=Neolewinella antarctica TaxID=442734 RepID=A0ABX0XAA7_9BACT|nr:SusE domain-containing protein [Neolewinella antarctica]NJC26183.1 hypothetical protein [Neolewinella antarctica]
MLKQSVYLLAALLVFGFSACADESADPVLRLGSDVSIVEPSDGANYVITEDNLDTETLTFSWGAADFGVPTAINYTLEADLADNDFADPVNLVPTLTGTTASVGYKALNSLLINREIAAGTATSIEVRVRAVVGKVEDNNQSVSPPLSIVVTPFAAAQEFPKFFVPGAYQNWMPGSDEIGLLYSVEDNGIYQGFIFMGDGGEYKFAAQPDWNPVNYGDEGADGTLDLGSDQNILAPGTGFHYISIDVNDLTYTQQATSWGLIGNATATGWDNDTDLTYDESTGNLTITTDLTTGDDVGFKFRANDVWSNTTDLGDNGSDGSLEFEGSNLSVEEAGNYTITLILQQAIPTYTLVKN